MDSLTTLHVLDGEYDGGLPRTRTSNYQRTSLVGGKRTAKDNETDENVLEGCSLKDDGCEFFFGKKNIMYKGGEVWRHKEIISV